MGWPGWQVVAHELAHQWFGNLTTMQWWDNLRLIFVLKTCNSVFKQK